MTIGVLPMVYPRQQQSSIGNSYGVFFKERQMLRSTMVLFDRYRAVRARDILLSLNASVYVEVVPDWNPPAERHRHPVIRLRVDRVNVEVWLRCVPRIANLS